MGEPEETLLNEHLAAENAHDLDRIMATYTASPLLELNGSRIEGVAAVREFHRAFGFGGQGSFSDVRVAERHRHRAAHAIVVEQTLSGVHTGSWRGLGATGRSFSIDVCTIYAFEGGRLAYEHVYLDEGRLRHQLTRAEDEAPFSSSRDVIVRTESFDDAIAFYGTVLGLRPTLRGEAIVGFETGAVQLFVEKGAPAHGAVLEMHVPDVDAAKARLQAAGCSIVEEDPRIPRCYVRDPFGLVFNLAAR